MKFFYLSIITLTVASSPVKALGFARDLSAYPGGNSNATTTSTRFSSNSSSNGTTSQDNQYWLEKINHQGTAAFNSDSSYQVFRNVKDFGAKGDGISDDTAALNLAISNGSRCRPGSCDESTTSPALVFIPGGTYLISAPIIDFYFTQIIGNPNNRPIFKATENFTGFAMIDGNPYRSGNAANPAGILSYKATNVFYRQIKNLILDTTDVPARLNIKAIHWPTAQATSLQNLLIRMNDQIGTQHQGLFIESGSGGWLSDLEFYGGLTGAVMGNQQFTCRNLWFYNAVEAIEQVYDWGWTYKSIHITNCSVGLNMTNVDPATQNVGSVVIIDSYFANTPIGIATSHDSNHWAVSNGSLILENVGFQSVQLAVQGTQGWTALPTNSGDLHVQAWGIGHEYALQGPYDFLGTLPAASRVASLTAGSSNGTYYERSKPDYRSVPVTSFLSVKANGALGDGVTDDTDALQKTLDKAATTGDYVVFFDAGTYRITKTIQFPKSCRVIGESYPVIMSSGSFFADIKNPQPVVQVGKPGDVGMVEWADMIVSTQGSQAGAILIEWNVATVGQPSGMWDVHTRIGGFAGSKLGVAECPMSKTASMDTTSRNSTIKGRNTGLSPRYNVGFSVYEGVAVPTYVTISGGLVPQASPPALASSVVPPSPIGSPSSSLSSTSLLITSSTPAFDLMPPVEPTLTSSLRPPMPSPPPLSSAESTNPSPTFVPTSTSIDSFLVNLSPEASSTQFSTAPNDLDSQGQSNSTIFNTSASNPATSNSSTVNEACMGAFMSMHITNCASGLYMENVWLWTADHDLDAPLANITVYSGRGLLVESEKGNIWIVGTSSEHHSIYQYQLAHTQNVVLGQMQSETAYYQPSPAVGTPFPPVESLNDPDSSDHCKNGNATCDGFGLRIVESQHVAIYGAGLYSFFNNYDESCSFHANGESCQQSIFSIEGSSCTDITVYNLNTVGAESMVDRDGTSLAKYSDNVDVFPDTIALFHLS